MITTYEVLKWANTGIKGRSFLSTLDRSVARHCSKIGRIRAWLEKKSSFKKAELREILPVIGHLVSDYSQFVSMQN